jgi:tetratricopeptide (TPR) repeat protein
MVLKINKMKIISKVGIGVTKIFVHAVFALLLAVCLVTGADVKPPLGAEAERTWLPRIVKLALEFPEVHTPNGWRERRKTALPHFVESIETKPIKHAEKLNYYYALLSPKRKEILEKCLATPYNRPEAMALMLSMASGTEQEQHLWRRRWNRAILREFPLYYEGLLQATEGWNGTVIWKALNDQAAAEKVPLHSLLVGRVMNDTWTPYHKINGDTLIEIGRLREQMGDYKRAAHAYQNADIRAVIDTNIRINKDQPHTAWEKLAALYEKIGDWDMALHWRLKQLAGTVEDLTTGGPERTQARRKELTDKIIYLLARIGAAEPVDPPPPPHKPDVETLRRISQHYCDMWFPNLGMIVVEEMEQLAGKQLVEDRARILEAQANVLSKASSTTASGKFWVVLWDEVWTYDKVVAVHKQAIEWGKKAGWDEARIKKLEDQITKLPELLKYVKEPKNFQDLLEGKATEPKW